MLSFKSIYPHKKNVSIGISGNYVSALHAEIWWQQKKENSISKYWMPSIGIVFDGI